MAPTLRRARPLLGWLGGVLCLAALVGVAQTPSPAWAKPKAKAREETARYVPTYAAAWAQARARNAVLMAVFHKDN